MAISGFQEGDNKQGIAERIASLSQVLSQVVPSLVAILMKKEIWSYDDFLNLYPRQSSVTIPPNVEKIRNSLDLTLHISILLSICEVDEEILKRYQINFKLVDNIRHIRNEWAHLQFRGRGIHDRVRAIEEFKQLIENLNSDIELGNFEIHLSEIQRHAVVLLTDKLTSLSQVLSQVVQSLVEILVRQEIWSYDDFLNRYPHQSSVTIPPNVEKIRNSLDLTLHISILLSICEVDEEILKRYQINFKLVDNIRHIRNEWAHLQFRGRGIHDRVRAIDKFKKLLEKLNEDIKSEKFKYYVLEIEKQKEIIRAYELKKIEEKLNQERIKQAKEKEARRAHEATIARKRAIKDLAENINRSKYIFLIIFSALYWQRALGASMRAIGGGLIFSTIGDFIYRYSIPLGAHLLWDDSINAFSLVWVMLLLVAIVTAPGAMFIFGSLMIGTLLLAIGGGLVLVILSLFFLS